MSRKLINHSADLKRLRDEGYFIQIERGFLVMREVPYVDRERNVRLGTLISTLTLAGDVTQPPDTHVVTFDGDEPCGADGVPLSQIIHQRGHIDHGGGLAARFSFSSKPSSGYRDYYEKMSTYAAILSGPAAVLQPGISPRVFRTPDREDDSVFQYTETASDRVGIGHLTELLADEKVIIIGLGGTGSYILDLVAKTPVSEIHLIDADEFLQHNAFRAPGAPKLEQLREATKKVDYFQKIYSRMHRRIFTHPVSIGADNLHLLEGGTFVFISMDAGEPKRLVVDKLEQLDIPFIDVGMGLELVDGSLGGILRVTTSVPAKRDHFREHVSFAGDDGPNVYSSNVQVADLNALNAVLAVIKWKKLRGFYRDLEEELHSSFTTDGNMLLNGGRP